MMPQEISENSMRWPYNVAAANVDLRSSRVHTQPGFLTMCAGVDGRFTGTLRRYPGHKAVADLRDDGLEGVVDFFDSVEIQKTGTAGQLRGFVYRRGANVVFYYYDTDEEEWDSFLLDAGSSAGRPISVTCNKQFGYYLREGDRGLIFYWDPTDDGGSPIGMVGKYLGVDDDEITPSVPVVDNIVADETLQTGKYYVAYRFYDSYRDLYSGMSEPLLAEQGFYSGDDGYGGQFKLLGGQATTSYNKLQVFRSISVDVAGTAFAGGTLYLEGTYDMPADEGGTNNWESANIVVGVMRDEVLVQQDYYDPWLDMPTAAPCSGVGCMYQGTLFTGGPEDEEYNGNSQLRWSAVHIRAPENFPVENGIQFDREDEKIIGFVPVGDTLFALSRSLCWKIRKLGGQMTVLRMQHARGASGARAGWELGRDMLLVTDSSILLVDSETGAVNSVAALDLLVTERWAGKLSKVSVATDAELGATFILNPETEEAAVVWHNNNGINLLEDMRFVQVISVADPVAGGPPRALFITEEGRVVTPNAGREDQLTQLGVDGTLNGVAGEGSTGGSIVGTGFSDDLDGCYVYMLTGDSAGEKALVDTSTTTEITLVGDGFTKGVEAGDVFAVSPIPYRVRYWPLWGGEAQGAPHDVFTRKVATSMGLFHRLIDGDITPASPWLFYTVGAFRQGEDTMGTPGTKIVMTNTITGSFGAEPFAKIGTSGVSGGVVEPYVEQLASDVDFELLSTLVHGRLDASRKP